MAIKHLLHFSVIICTIGFQILTICFQIWAMVDYNIAEAWYGSEEDTGSSYFNIRYGPPVWFVGLIWTLVYLFQIAWLAYCLSTLCRRAPLSDEKLYYDPYYMPLSMYLALLLHFILELVWAASIPSCSAICPVLQLGSFLTMVVALVVSLRALVNEGAALYRLALSREVGLVRALLHNGLACYATWLLIDLTISLSGVMVRDGYGQKEASVTMFGVLGIFLVAYIIMDIPLLDIYLRYTVSPYIAFSLYFLAIVSAHIDGGMVYVMAAIVLVIALLGASFKVFIIVARRRSNPEPIPFTEALPQRPRRRSASSIATRMSTRMPIGGMTTDAVAVPYM